MSDEKQKDHPLVQNAMRVGEELFRKMAEAQRAGGVHTIEV